MNIKNLSSSNFQSIPGTECGEGKWCDNGSCVNKEENFIYSPTLTYSITTMKPVWTAWRNGSCKTECIKNSKGSKIKYRTCISDGNCEGSSVEHELCDDSKLCTTRKSIIEYGTQKCRVFSNRVTSIDGKGLGLQARFEPLRLWMPCAIFCKHKNSSSYFSPRIELHEMEIDPYFPDGTWCNREGNVNYYCLQHHCLPEVFFYQFIHYFLKNIYFIEHQAQ